MFLVLMMMVSTSWFDLGASILKVKTGIDFTDCLVNRIIKLHAVNLRNYVKTAICHLGTPLVIQFLLAHSNERHSRVICAHDSERTKIAEPSLFLVLD